MEDASCMQPHALNLLQISRAHKKESAIYRICNNSKASSKLRNKWSEVEYLCTLF
jgi:hypothetical protein